MRAFTYTRATDEQAALNAVFRNPEAKFIGGGTNLVDLMREEVERPSEVVDINALPFKQINELPDGSVRLGALARNSHTANHPLLRQRYPVLTQAMLSAASPQLRNLATNAGNLLQRTRCYYFYDITAPCNKRQPGSGCAAIHGVNRIHAILGTSEQCIATHPSDMAVALAVLDAVVQVQGSNGGRSIPIEKFHRLPGDTPEQDTNLGHDELITSIDLPALPFATNSLYLKVRDRPSFAFALVSVAVVLELEDDKIKNVRLALGGVAHKPWRAHTAEQALLGASATAENFRQAAEAELQTAIAYEHNAFKIELAKRTIVRALTTLAERNLA
ncbi:xanthine dehydrogenase family protein subunit M [Hymenobacter sp. GOD-10R]|uniref:FAD binding domain-containing protein n=1 Tax=Hymenobacter sp. GOD-10R TaxID=3093922 RepID=UPI002D77FBD1|nr:xanthine dehydrogenase family protein subunit M [Hymenobacter sp. GOD-10R]WRQ28692.1 xanthine dehydrogenase family protein subunit M [Hymenobacter sp. GOD-10R]